MRPYIPIDYFPQQFEYEFNNGDIYTIGINHNETHDSFSIDLYDPNGDPIVLGEPIILNEPLWQYHNDPRLPVEQIIPMDEADKEIEINSNNFGNTVQLYLDILDEDSNGAPIKDDGDDINV